MNTNLKWTGGNRSNPTRHVCHLPLYFSLASPEPVFSFTSQVSTVRSCQKSWPKPEAGPPLCRWMSSFVRRLGILSAWGRPRSSCVDARLEANHYTADDSHGPCHRALDKTFSVSVKMKQEKHREAWGYSYLLRAALRSGLRSGEHSFFQREGSESPEVESHQLLAGAFLWEGGMLRFKQ